ncbi:MAG TPA: hypothetical protein PKM22_12840, partial [Candidatus Hydrogenedentes bacterium]|nr:hypothetical protein [Candidatus Hydrogenedentota bacterium]
MHGNAAGRAFDFLAATGALIEPLSPDLYGAHHRGLLENLAGKRSEGVLEVAGGEEHLTGDDAEERFGGNKFNFRLEDRDFQSGEEVVVAFKASDFNRRL